jgi:hypothetical protein
VVTFLELRALQFFFFILFLLSLCVLQCFPAVSLISFQFKYLSHNSCVFIFQCEMKVSRDPLTFHMPHHYKKVLYGEKSYPCCERESGLCKIQSELAGRHCMWHILASKALFPVIALCHVDPQP